MVLENKSTETGGKEGKKETKNKAYNIRIHFLANGSCYLIKKKIYFRSEKNVHESLGE